MAVDVDGELRDLRLPLSDGEHVRILTDRDDEALAVLRHSTAHVMAEAVLHLWPGTKVAIGPAIADGFYYDFEFPEPISADDLERIEAEMRRILASEHPFRRTDGVDKAELLRRFEAEQQPYKLELARDLPDGEISLYTQDGFEDLCRGPHLQTTKPIKAFKLLSTAGAYWRGDSKNTMLTRIYGTAFFYTAGAGRPPGAAGGGPPPRPSPAGPRPRPVPFLGGVAGLAVLASARRWSSGTS